MSERTIQRAERGSPVSDETARSLAAAFDVDVKDLEANEVPSPFVPHQLHRLVDGRGLVRIIGDAQMHRFDHDPAPADEDVEAVAAFFQDLHDYGEIWSDMEPMHRVEAEREFRGMLADLADRGWHAFGCSRLMTIRFATVDGEPRSDEWGEATVVLRQANDPRIVNPGTDAECLLALLPREARFGL